MVTADQTLPYLFALLFLTTSLIHCASVASHINDTLNDPSMLFPLDLSNHLMRFWLKKSSETYDPSRRNRILKLFQRNSGIYTNNDKSQYNSVKGTILLNVVSLNEGKTINVYRQILRNWLCYSAHYDYMPVVYFLSDPSDANHARVPSITKNLGEINKNAIFIDYPTHLFWDLLTQKTLWTSLRKERGLVDFVGDYPNFQHFGALVMLVPILEVLDSGFSVIYVDIDIALVKDPIPFIALGISDINVSPEVKRCIYHSRTEDMRVSYSPFKNEPNTGLMMIRSTDLGPKLMRKFLLELVNKNKANDQPYLKESLGLRHTSDCQYNYSKTLHQNIVKEGMRPHKEVWHEEHFNSTSTGERKATLCLMQDILFQNGMLAFTCAEKGQDKTEYLLMMNRLARVGSSDGTTTQHTPVKHDNTSSTADTRHSNGKAHTQEYTHSRPSFQSGSRSRRDLAEKWDPITPVFPSEHLGIAKNDLNLISPLTVHANYCGNKQKCFMDRGLWLLETYTPTHTNTNSSPSSSFTSSFSSSSSVHSSEEEMKFRCKAYNKEDTLYGTPTWTIGLNEAENKLQQYLKRFKVGDVIQYGRNPEIYILDYPDSRTVRKSSSDSSVTLNAAIGVRAIPNMVTLDKLGFPSIEKLSDVLPSYMTIGRDILDLTNTNMSYTISSNLSFLDIYGLYKAYEHSMDTIISTMTSIT